jgi:hypothetical protein
MQSTRREFVAGTVGTLVGAAGLQAQTPALTVQQAVDIIRAQAPPRTGGMDGLKAGDPAAVVTGILAVAMATIPVFPQATGGRYPNLIVTLEPTFYSANDEPGARASDPVLLAKMKAIEERRLAIYRISDQWEARFAPSAAAAIAAVHGGRPVAGAPRVFEIPQTTLGELASKHATGGRRVVGKADMPVKRIFISPGGTTLQATMEGLKQADVAIVGEPREWEAVPYVHDSITAGLPKGMILLGRIVSENAGLNGCVEWLKGLFPGMPVAPVTIPDPYWKAGA